MRPLLAALIPVSAFAQTDAETAVLPRIIDTGCFELVEMSAGCEQVTLLRSETDAQSADLLIYPNRRNADGSGPLLVARGVAFDGPTAGVAPTLEGMNDGVRLRSQQSELGRYPWFSTVDFRHDGAVFLVTRFTYSAYDRALPRSVTCDVNLETGAYRVEVERGNAQNPDADPEVAIRTGQDDPVLVPLASFQQGWPARCADANFDAFYSD